MRTNRKTMQEVPPAPCAEAPVIGIAMILSLFFIALTMHPAFTAPASAQVTGVEAKFTTDAVTEVGGRFELRGVVENTFLISDVLMNGAALSISCQSEDFDASVFLEPVDLIGGAMRRVAMDPEGQDLSFSLRADGRVELRMQAEGPARGVARRVPQGMMVCVLRGLIFGIIRHDAVAVVDFPCDDAGVCETQ